MTILSQKSWRGELKYEIPNGNGGVTLKSYGYFNYDDITAGSESTTIQDPEDGGQIVGGVPTADEFGINRPWKLTRDSVVYAELKPLRGRSKGQFVIWELDPVTGQPVSANPTDTLSIQVKETTLPGADRNGSDPSMIAINLTQQP